MLPADSSLPEPDAEGAARRDALHALARLYLRHADVPRALTLLLVAAHLARPSASLLLSLAQAFLAVGQPEQAIAGLDRHDRDFGPARGAQVLRARCLLALGRTGEARAAFAAAPEPPA